MIRLRSSISKAKLRQGKYLPDQLVALKEAPFDSEAKKRFYEPAVELLHSIFNNN